jgi:hypothetical protein
MFMGSNHIIEDLCAGLFHGLHPPSSVVLLGEAFGKGKCRQLLAHNLPFYAVILSAAKDLRLLFVCPS